jgi:alkanesulfonate monooxygenase SsuD/methylene tetrahydromethanopterin reductase-like flavin-dependent oxidoreductase (luciferase family)
LKFDIFFSISQTPAAGRLPSEVEMFANFFSQVEAADELGFETAWVAEAHLSSEVQKSNRRPVIPHWKGEVGLNTDILQLAARIFARTERIEVGSAVMNILCNGGPIAAAERIAAFLALHGLDPSESRRLHVGFAAGRFDFNNAASGVAPQNQLEEAFWPVFKGKIFEEAAQIFLRLLRGDVLSSDDIASHLLPRESFRDDEDWMRAAELAASHGLLVETADGPAIPVRKQWVFEALKIVPQNFRRDLLNLIIGSHDPRVQEFANSILPVQVFNLSITRPEIIEDTHRRMAEKYHPDGGLWRRDYMPRTVFVFLNDEDGLSAEECREAAHAESRAALGAYWTALEGTLDPAKVEKAADNAIVGNVADVTNQILDRFHPDDRLMLWFDFFNHDNARVIRNMRAFMEKVAPAVRAKAV